MPTWRKLHVKTVESLDLNDMPDDFTRLLWVLLPLGLDREGRGLDHAGWVRAKVLPLRDDVTNAMIENAMTWYAGRDMIERYEVDGRRYFHVLTWRSYQGNTSREAASHFPAPAQDLLTTSSGPTQDEGGSGSSSDVDVDVDVDVEVEEEASSSLCLIHHVPFVRFSKNGDSWWAHQTASGGWCKRVPLRAAPSGRDYIKGELGDLILH